MSTQREAVGELWDKMSSDEAASEPAETKESVETAEAAPEPEAAEAETKEPARDESGRFAKPQVRKKGASEPKVEVRPQPAKPTEPARPPEPELPRAPLTPPRGWKVAMREKFNALPPDIQDEILRREEEHVSLAAQSAQARQAWADVQRRLAAHEEHLRPLGLSAIDAAERLLGVHRHLQTGTPQQRAAMLAKVALDYGLTAEQFAQALQGAPQQQHAPPVNPAQFRDPRLDAFLAQQEAERRATLGKQVTAFAKDHEFFEDVRETMANLLDGGAAEDLQEAYDIAVSLPKHRDIREALDRRRAADDAKARAAQAAKAKAASSSPRSSPATATNGTTPTSQRAAIEAIFDDLSAR